VLAIGRPDVTPAGNRVAEGRGALDRVDPVDIALPSRPTKLAPLSHPSLGPLWWVELDTGDTIVVGLDGVVDRAIAASRGNDLMSSFTNPLPDGTVVEWGDTIVALVGPTDRYPHGVLGDRLEASAVGVVDSTTGAGTTFGPAEPTVIEGLAPLLADIDGDGTPEVLVTHSNADVGAWLALWTLDGRLLAESAPIGRGNRWRNQLAIAPIGPRGELEVIDVRTPHIGGTVEFFRVEGAELVRVAAIEGFTNHQIGSRNVDLGIVADADGDGSLNVVLPTDERRSLGVLERVGDSVAVVATIALDGRITTNVGVAAGPDGRLSFAVGTDQDTLHIWPPG